MSERHTRRIFLARSARLAAGATTLSLLGTAPGTGVARAHNVTGNAQRAEELYNAMQKYFYVADKKLYLETSPKANSNPYAYLWPFYEAVAGTIDLYGVKTIAIYATAVQDRLKGLEAYYRGAESGYDSYVRSPHGNGGDRYYDDNAWVARALIQLYRMDRVKYASALGGAEDVFTFLKTGWDRDRGGVYWVAADWNRDRGAGPTGGFAKVALHLYDVTGRATASYRERGEEAYRWVNDNLLAQDGEYADRLYWDKIRGDGSLDRTFWSYNQGVMIGAGVLLHRLTGQSQSEYLRQAITTADTALDYYANRVGWYSQPVIFNALFFRNLLLLYAVTNKSAYRAAMQDYANKVWDNSKIHNQQKHLIKFEEWTRAYKLREQAAMVQIYACLAWIDADQDLSNLA